MNPCSLDRGGKMAGSRKLNLVSCLADLALFKGMGTAELARIAAFSSTKHLARGEDLFQAGQACEGLYFVVDGLIKLYAKAANGQEKVLEVVSPGGCVCEALAFSESGHGVHAGALMDALVLFVPKPVLVQELERNTGLAMRLLKGLSRRMNGLLKDIEAVTLHSGVQRVVDYLLHAPSVPEEPTQQQNLTVSLPASKGTIASLLSVTPEHFSRILHELQSRGLISVERRQIHILDAQGLAQYV
ncbi:MAG: Crp/Fnr family transcriptional regulator [Burkholderiales bacterium]|jgi:CRP-like cAMP-binding protein|nr:MAG: Crp/Fnr family transcriptional regulator [Burkholderiales bacterium]